MLSAGAAGHGEVAAVFPEARMQQRSLFLLLLFALLRGPRS